MPKEAAKIDPKEHAKTIGGSDLAAILGLNPYCSPFQVWQRKVEGAVVEENEAMYWGKKLEALVASRFEEVTGKKLERRNKLYTHKDSPLLTAHVDRYVVGEKAIWEGKSTGLYNRKNWGEDMTDHVPVPAHVQVQHYQYVTGYQNDGYIAVLLGGNQFHWYVIPYDDQLTSRMEDQALEWWDKYVVTGTPPPPVSSAEATQVYKGQVGEALVADCKQVQEALRELEQVKRDQAIAKVVEAEAKLVIQKAMGDAKADLLVDAASGDTLVTWKESKSKRINTKALKKAEPKLYEKYQIESLSRRFLLK